MVKIFVTTLFLSDQTMKYDVSTEETRLWGNISTVHNNAFTIYCLIYIYCLYLVVHQISNHSQPSIYDSYENIISFGPTSIY